VKIAYQGIDGLLGAFCISELAEAEALRSVRGSVVDESGMGNMNYELCSNSKCNSLPRAGDIPHLGEVAANVVLGCIVGDVPD